MGFWAAVELWSVASPVGNSYCNRNTSHKEDPLLGWGKRLAVVCQIPYHYHYIAVESSLNFIIYGIDLKIKVDNRKKIICYVLFTIYTTLLLNENY